MKTKTLILTLLICAMSKAQITLENSYQAPSTSYGMQVVELVKSGYKYQLSDLKNGVVKLYNANHSLFKTISVPKPTGFNYTTYPLVSDSLFNNDVVVEVLYGYAMGTFTSTPVTYTAAIKVVDENGTSLFNMSDAGAASVAYMGPGNGYKLIVSIDSTNKAANKQTNIYSLIGGLPMHSQTHNGATTNLSERSMPSANLSNPLPNPSQNHTTIAYTLPEGVSSADLSIYDINGRELKRYTVDNTFNTLELDNTELASGTYLYQMNLPNGHATAKKMVIVK